MAPLPRTAVAKKQRRKNALTGPSDITAGSESDVDLSETQPEAENNDDPVSSDDFPESDSKDAPEHKTGLTRANLKHLFQKLQREGAIYPTSLVDDSLDRWVTPNAIWRNWMALDFSHFAIIEEDVPIWYAKIRELKPDLPQWPPVSVFARNEGMFSKFCLGKYPVNAFLKQILGEPAYARSSNLRCHSSMTKKSARALCKYLKSRLGWSPADPIFDLFWQNDPKVVNFLAFCIQVEWLKPTPAPGTRDFLHCCQSIMIKYGNTMRKQWEINDEDHSTAAEKDGPDTRNDFDEGLRLVDLLPIAVPKHHYMFSLRHLMFALEFFQLSFLKDVGSVRECKGWRYRSSLLEFYRDYCFKLTESKVGFRPPYEADGTVNDEGLVSLFPELEASPSVQEEETRLQKEEAQRKETRARKKKEARDRKKERIRMAKTAQVGVGEGTSNIEEDPNSNEALEGGPTALEQPAPVSQASEAPNPEEEPLDAQAKDGDTKDSTESVVAAAVDHEVEGAPLAEEPAAPTGKDGDTKSSKNSTGSVGTTAGNPGVEDAPSAEGPAAAPTDKAGENNTVAAKRRTWPKPSAKRSAYIAVLKRAWEVAREEPENEPTCLFEVSAAAAALAVDLIREQQEAVAPSEPRV